MKGLALTDQLLIRLKKAIDASPQTGGNGNQHQQHHNPVFTELLSETRQPTRLRASDLNAFNAGYHFRLYEKLGAHPMRLGGCQGTYFAIWAPNAAQVSVKGDFNDWRDDRHLLSPRGQSGIWEGFIPNVTRGTRYQYRIVSCLNHTAANKADPFAFYTEVPPQTASIVWDCEYEWHDQDWLAQRQDRHALDAPLAIYEVHLGSWMRVPEESDRSLTYREIAPKLAAYVKQLGFTHVELLPITEHPFYGSWGYQTTGYFAPTSRYGTSQDFMYLVDYLHQQDIGVILDWVPSHFAIDEHGLSCFDGTHLFEHEDPRQGYHPDWGSFIFNYSRYEVKSFLISSAFFWLDKYHIDGLRVDAVASMLYLDYSRPPGEWIPNLRGGKENLGAIAFLRCLNQATRQHYPDVITLAEDSTDWPRVSHPTSQGGLGFSLKWDMGWMHDTLSYLSHDPIERRHHHHQLTFRMLYANQESYVLPLSHDEVVHGKGSLLNKMPGDEWQKFANLRALYGYMYAQPGKKLLFMGTEFGQWREWHHERSLDWHLVEHPLHRSLQRWVTDLNWLYRQQPALHRLDCHPQGFEWVDCHDQDNSVLSFLRKVETSRTGILVVCNFTPVPRHNYRLGVPRAGFWRELLNSDAQIYGGSGLGNLGGQETEPIPWHGRAHSLSLTLPPLAVLFLQFPTEPREDADGTDSLNVTKSGLDQWRRKLGRPGKDDEAMTWIFQPRSQTI